MTVPILSVVAQASGTGKTTVMERLIAELTVKGWRVGAIKNDAHRMKIDYEGKDSWRFAQAGAWSVAVLSPESYAVIQRVESSVTPNFIAAQLKGVDIILIEGFRYGDKPKIEVVRKEQGGEILSPPGELIAVVSDYNGPKVEVPLYSFEETGELAQFIEDKYLRESGPREFTHFDNGGRAHMVDVTEKNDTKRVAIARGEIAMSGETLIRIKEGRMSKGDVLAVAQVAAVMGVKETSRLIPMCHPLIIGGVSVDFYLDEEENIVLVTVKVKMTGQTGVEMEALTGVSLALLTIYDMCKAVDKNMVMGNIRLLEKKGGRSGHYVREGEERWER